MAKILYIANVSLDGYTEDAEGSFDFTVPTDEVFACITDILRRADTYLYGRRMYETMAPWETDASLASQSALRAEFAALWQAADKVVYSSTLDAPFTARTRLERDFDAAAVREMKTNPSADITVGGPGLAASLFRAGLIDEIHLFVAPVVIGGGKPALPAGVRAELELLDERRFAGGTVYLRHACEGGS